MKNSWKRIKFNYYEFAPEKGVSLLVKFENLAHKISVFNIENNEIFSLNIAGMFRSSIQVKDSKQTVLLSLSATRWWKSVWQGTSGKQKIEIKVVNRPLVEYVLSVDGDELLSYGISISGMKSILTIQQFGAMPIQTEFMHVLLFSLIRPVLMESMGNQINMDI